MPRPLSLAASLSLLLLSSSCGPQSKPPTSHAAPSDCMATCMDSNAGGLKDYGPCSASCDRPIVAIAPKTPLCSERTQGQNFGFDAPHSLKSDEGETVNTPLNKDSEDTPSCPDGTVRAGNRVFGGDVYCVPDSSDANGKRHGPYRCWEPEFVGGRSPYSWENGTLLIRGQYRNGEKHGVWTYWDQFGQKVKEETTGLDLAD